MDVAISQDAVPVIKDSVNREIILIELTIPSPLISINSAYYP
jgi:hypothetical protein